MATNTDDEDRMGLARERARDVVGRLPVGGRVTVVAAADTADVLVSETDDTDAALDLRVVVGPCGPRRGLDDRRRHGCRG
jgi:hypothetical protein